MPAEKGTTAQDQRDEFLRQFGIEFGLRDLRVDDWGSVFHLLAEQLKHKKAILLLDEISWMGSKDRNFLGKLKIVWDSYFSENDNLTLI